MPPPRRLFVTDVLRFVFSGRRLWLLPIALILILVSLLAAVGALAPYSAFSIRCDLMIRPSPTRVLAAALLVSGGLVLWVNRADPDESRALGACVAGLGGLGVWQPSRLRHVVEAVAVALLVLTGGEGMLRHENAIAADAYADRTMHFVDDPWLRYELKPDLTCDKALTNSFGMIDPPRTLDKAPGTLRVACLGDSVGGDCSLPRENTCAALEGILRRARGGKPVEVLNFSVPGYNTMQEARALETKALRFSPDAVVILYVINDPYPDLAVSHFLPGHFKFEHLVASGAELATWKLLGVPRDPIGSALARLHETPRSWNGVVVAGFDRIRVVADAGALPVVVATFPLFVERPSAETRAVYAKVVREAEGHGFVGLDLSEVAFRGEPVASLLKPSGDVIHPNAHAHQLAAESIARALLARRPELAR